MKATRKIFAIYGEAPVVRKVLECLDGFKAVTALMDTFSYADIESVFNKNKSVACYSESLLKLYPTVLNDFIDVYLTENSIAIGYSNVINVEKNIVLQFMEIAEKNNVDIGDHISNNRDFGPTQEDCLFCKLIDGEPVHEQAILYESKNFIVIPGSGAFVEGYIMIVPKAHVMSCAELSTEQRKEMLTVIEDIKFILNWIYGTDILVWENGSGRGGIGKPKTSIVHAHIHVCPSQMNICLETEATGIPIYPISFDDLPKYKENSYLLINDYYGNWYISYDEELYIPRQYIRQLIAAEHHFGGEIWNWRRYAFWDEAEKNGNDFLDFVRNNYLLLPKSIKDATRKFIW